MSLPLYKKGKYKCPECNKYFYWGYGFTEEKPDILENNILKEKCPLCCGLIFNNPTDILNKKNKT